jgi:hypothetical protein
MFENFSGEAQLFMLVYHVFSILWICIKIVEVSKFIYKNIFIFFYFMRYLDHVELLQSCVKMVISECKTVVTTLTTVLQKQKEDTCYNIACKNVVTL